LEARVRLPWLQIDADGQTRARLLGRLLGIPEPQGLGIALSLWTWALEMSPDGDFTGEVHGDAELVAAAVSWPIEDSGRLLTELCRVGFIARQPLRVRGLDRYRSTWEKNRRKGHGRDNQPDSRSTRAGSPRDPLVSRGNPERKTETETEKKELPAPQPKRERKLSAAEEFFGWLTATRAAKTKLSDEPLTARGINAAFGRALAAVGRPTLERCYLAFLDEPDGAQKSPPWPWRSFLARYASLQRRPAVTSQTESLAL